MRARGSRTATNTGSGALPEQSATATAPSRPTRLRRSDVVRADGRVLRRVYLYLDLALVRRIAQHCAANDVTINDVVAEGVGQLLDKTTDKSG